MKEMAMKEPGPIKARVVFGSHSLPFFVEPDSPRVKAYQPRSHRCKSLAKLCLCMLHPSLIPLRQVTLIYFTLFQPRKLQMALEIPLSSHDSSPTLSNTPKQLGNVPHRSTIQLYSAPRPISSPEHILLFLEETLITRFVFAAYFKSNNKK